MDNDNWREKLDRFLAGESVEKILRSQLEADRPGGVDSDAVVDIGDTWDELNTKSDAEESEPWLIKGILPARGVVLVLGEQKSGKTLWVSLLVSQVLDAGHGATYAMQESAQSILRTRMRLAIASEHDKFRSLYRRRHHLTDDGGLARLAAAVRGNNSRVVVLDSLTRFCPGLDLNKAEVMSLVCDRLERLSAAAECCVIVIHHPRKSGGGQNARKELSSADSRGSGDLLAVASVIALVERAERAKRHEYAFTVRCEDSWYEPFDKQIVTVRFREAPHIVLTTEEQAEKEADSSHREIQSAIVKAVEDSPMEMLSINAIFSSATIKTLTRNSRLLRKLLDELLGDGELVERPGMRGARMISLPGPRSNPVSEVGAKSSEVPSTLSPRHFAQPYRAKCEVSEVNELGQTGVSEVSEVTGPDKDDGFDT